MTLPDHPHWLLVKIMRSRWKLNVRHRDNLMRMIEKYGGITSSDLVRDWRAELDATAKRIADLEARLHRAGATVW